MTELIKLEKESTLDWSDECFQEEEAVKLQLEFIKF